MLKLQQVSMDFCTRLSSSRTRINLNAFNCGVHFRVPPGTGGEYHATERGYLYFDLPQDSDVAIRDWREFKRIADTNVPGSVVKGIVAFGRRGMSARVRTSDESPHDPETYGGTGVRVVGYQDTSRGVQLLGRILKPPHRYNYALVDRVIVEPTDVLASI
jgi:hypothetical protein